MKNIPIPALLAAALFILGCGRSGGLKESGAMKSREWQAANAAERLENYDDAIRYYNATINKYHDVALAHLQLAIILHEKKRDYLGAIINYRRYIETSGNGGQRDFAIISNRIAKAEELLSAEYVRKIAAGESSLGVNSAATIAELNARVAKLEGDKKTLASSNETLRAEVRRLNNKVDSQLVWIKRIQNSPSGGPGAPGKIDSITVTDADGNSKVVQTYEVRPGENLSMIAEYVYGDAKLWPRIRDANTDKIKDDRVKVGDVLVIP